MKKTHNNKNGFTLIELIIVMVILGIMAAVAVPRYLDSIANAEESAENAVISAVRSGLKQYANNALVDGGRATWPTNPFDAVICVDVASVNEPLVTLVTNILLPPLAKNFCTAIEVKNSRFSEADTKVVPNLLL